MKVEILSVGTELLMGQIANTNAQYISKRLPEVGLGVFYHSVVGDNPERLSESLRLALQRADVVITTGGLGPTQDDLTKDTVSDTLHLPMVLHQKSFEQIRAYFEKAGRTVVESNYRQAYFPAGSIVMENGMGTAPGCIIPVPAEAGNCAETPQKFVVMLPGPPKELIPMFDNHVLPFFAKRREHPLRSRFLRVVGVGESLVEEKIIGLVEGQTNPTFATYAKDGIVTIRVTAEDIDGNGDALLERAQNQICEILGDSVYTTENEDLEMTVFRLLKARGLTVATAESCTGGMLAEQLTEIPGASDVFLMSAVTYANAAKMNILGVKEETLAAHTAVSAAVAKEMAEGLRKISGADVCVSITGLAGPGGGTKEIPVGTVFIGVKYGETVSVSEHHFTSGNRNRVRTLSVIYALDRVRRAILGL